MPKFQQKVIQDSNLDFRINLDRMSVGSVPKCCGCIILLASVILPSIVQSALSMRNANKCPKIPYSTMVKKMKKLSGIDTRIWITTISSMPAKFGRHPFGRLSVILFTDWVTEWHNDHITSRTSVWLAEVTRDSPNLKKNCQKLLNQNF